MGLKAAVKAWDGNRKINTNVFEVAFSTAKSMTG